MTPQNQWRPKVRDDVSLVLGTVGYNRQKCPAWRCTCCRTKSGVRIVEAGGRSTSSVHYTSQDEPHAPHIVPPRLEHALIDFLGLRPLAIQLLMFLFASP